MSRNRAFDDEIRAALYGMADGIKVSAEAEGRILAEIDKMQNAAMAKEERKMKKLSVRLGGVVCALACLSCMTVMAATGIIGGWAGHNIVGTDVYTFAAVSGELTPELEFEPVLIEEFANGFTFTKAHLGSFTALDENNEPFGEEYTDLWIDYANAVTGETVHLSYSNAPEVPTEPLPGEPQAVSRVVDQVTLSYTEMPYKFVPVDYQMSAEEQTAVDSGALYVSYGSDSVQEQTSCGVTWTVNGIKHHLFGWDLTLGADGMLDMAEELLAE